MGSSFRFTAKLWGRYRNFSHTPCFYTCIASPIINIPHQNGTFFTTDEPTLTHHTHSKSIISLWVHSNVIHSMGLDKCIMACIHHYYIIQEYFYYPKNPLLIHPYPPRPCNPWKPLIFFPSLHSFLLFPECHIVGIIQCVAFMNWLLSLSNIHLSFLHASSWFISSLLFGAE